MTARREQLRHRDASCTLFWDAPTWEGEPALAIGEFRCGSEADGEGLLRKACALAAQRGIVRIIGPMDGDTWHNYRLVSQSDGSAPFLMEPRCGPDDHAAFIAAGFETISEYVSARASLTRSTGEPAPDVPGITIEPWDGQNADALIGQLFDMSASAFARNAFFKPITKEAFIALYEPLVPLLDPRLILFARSADGAIAGYLFGLRNVNVRGQPDNDTVIIKTYASGVRGCGRLLVDSLHRRAATLGFTTVIHALMHVDNVSRDRSNKTGSEIFRRYALMGRRLDNGPSAR